MNHLDARADGATRPQGAMRSPLTVLRTWLGRSRARRHLSTLDDHMLADIGVRRVDVEKPFWKA